MTFDKFAEAKKEQEFQTKLAMVQNAYANDPYRQQALNEALNVISEDIKLGKMAPMDKSAALTTATEMVEAYIKEATLAKEAEIKLAEDYMNLGNIIGELFEKKAGISREELLNIKDPEECKLAGEIAAYLLIDEMKKNAGK